VHENNVPAPFIGVASQVGKKGTARNLSFGCELFDELQGRRTTVENREVWAISTGHLADRTESRCIGATRDKHSSSIGNERRKEIREHLIFARPERALYSRSSKQGPEDMIRIVARTQFTGDCDGARGELTRIVLPNGRLDRQKDCHLTPLVLVDAC
jgi:hypothetical protein